MRMKLVGAMLALWLSGCGDSETAGSDGVQPENTGAGMIVEVASSAGQFSTLIAAVEAAGLVETLQGDGPFTVFAPTDDAFAKLPEADLNALLADKESLTQVLLYHVAAGRIGSADVVASEGIDMVSGQRAPIGSRDDTPTIAGSGIIATDVEASNGVIHVIDTIMMPPKNIIETAQAAGSFSTLLTALDAAGLTETLAGEGPFTVFAPTDTAFQNLPDGVLDSLLADIPALTNVLLYHVTAGKNRAADVLARESLSMLNEQDATIATSSGPSIAGVKIVTTDIETSNGVIHVIEGVMAP